MTNPQGGGNGDSPRRRNVARRNSWRRERKTDGGECGIRTHGTLAGTHDFQSCPIVHSGNSPRRIERGRKVLRSVRGGVFEQVAERVGFEPTMELPPIPVFETGAFVRSAISPGRLHSDYSIERYRGNFGRLVRGGKLAWHDCQSLISEPAIEGEYRSAHLA